MCVFCASSDDVNPELRALARELGRALARRDIGLVYGGGGIGLMGEVSSAAMDAVEPRMLLPAGWPR